MNKCTQLSDSVHERCFRNIYWVRAAVCFEIDNCVRGHISELTHIKVMPLIQSILEDKLHEGNLDSR